VIDAISGRRYADLDALVAAARAQRGTLGLVCPESAPSTG
jgi:hypothetical protein